MRQTKRVPFCFSSHMYKAVEGYLNAQAAKGWVLEKVTFFDLARFRRAGEEAPRRYCVDLLPYHRRRAAKEQDEDYLNLCEEAGWTLMARQGSMGVFVSRPGADPAPIQTDREAERYRYRRVCRNGAFWVGLQLLLDLLLVIAVVALVQLVARADVARAVYQYLLTWLRSWLLGALGMTVPLLALLGLWRLGELAWSWVRTRQDGAIPTPARWALWANAAVNLLFLLAVLVLLAGVLAEQTRIGETTAFVSFVVAGAVLLFRGGSVREAQPRLMDGKWAQPRGSGFARRWERRQLLQAGALGLAMGAVALALSLAVGGSTVHFWRDNREQFTLYYTQASSLPLVREQDLGVEPEGAYTLSRGVGPAGRYALLMMSPGNSLDEELDGVSCSRYDCWTDGLAGAVVDALRAETVIPEHRTGTPGRILRDYRCELAPCALDWADEAWLGEWSDDNWAMGESRGQVLILRKGSVAVRVFAPADLTDENILENVRARLGL